METNIIVTVHAVFVSTVNREWNANHFFIYFLLVFF